MGLEGGMYVVRSGMEKGDPERIFRGWQILEENIERITAFVKEFLEFARGSTPEVKLAVQITCVCPMAIRQLPVAAGIKSPLIDTGRKSPGRRPSRRWRF